SCSLPLVAVCCLSISSRFSPSKHNQAAMLILGATLRRHSQPLRVSWREPSHDGTALIPHQAPGLGMTLYETAFRLQHDCPFNELSKQHPKLSISSWCNSETDVMEISADDPTSFNELRRDLKSVEKALN